MIRGEGMAERIGVNFPKEYWENIKEELIYLYINVIMSTYELAEKYECTPATIRLHLKQWGVYDKSINKHKRNEYIDYGDYVVGYTRSDKYEFYIDKKHYNIIKQYCWHRHQDGYLRTCIGHTENGGNIYKLMHVMIMEAEGVTCSDDEEIDHINGKPNDNKVSNLRIATHTNNMKNHKLMRNNKSGHSGVCYSEREDAWKAYIYSDNKRIHIGTFNSKQDAVNARKKYEEKYHKEYARPKEHLYNGTRQND
jgi:hypothetical protein